MLGSKGKTHPRVWRVGVENQVIDAGSSCNVVKDLRPTAHEKSKTIDLGRALEELGPWAFEGFGSLGWILLPDTVRSIGECAFLHCHSLTHASLPSTLFPVGDADRMGVLHWRDVEQGTDFGRGLPGFDEFLGLSAYV